MCGGLAALCRCVTPPLQPRATSGRSRSCAGLALHARHAQRTQNDPSQTAPHTADAATPGTCRAPQTTHNLTVRLSTTCLLTTRHLVATHSQHVLYVHQIVQLHASLRAPRVLHSHTPLDVATHRERTTAAPPRAQLRTRARRHERAGSHKCCCTSGCAAAPDTNFVGLAAA